MESFLDIMTGPSAGTSVPLAAGRSIVVGRGEKADIRLQNDSALAESHFALEGSYDSCQLRDLSGKGTLVNGVCITRSTRLKNGDHISAGYSRFAVRVRAAAPSVGGGGGSAGEVGRSVGKAEPTRPEEPRDLLEYLRSAPEPLYAILDAARDPMVLALMANAKEEHQSLYEGPKGEAMAEFGPWLVRLPPDSELLPKLVKEGWGKSWGVYLRSKAAFAEVRKHLRRFLTAQLPDGEEVYFRFYDPRVLRTYLPTCTSTELEQFLGPIGMVALEDPWADHVREYSIDQGNLRVRAAALLPMSS
jgi:hypothetical protein